MGVLGDLLYRGVSLWDNLAGNITTTRKFLRQTGTGAASAAPAWDTIVAGDLPNTTVIAGSYTNTNLTVDAQGRLTAATNGTAGAGTVTTTGSPASGNLSKFSGATSITNADLTGDVTTAGTVAATLANIPNDVPMAGDLLATAIVAPSTPASGKGRIYVDSTSKNLAVKDDAGVVKHGVRTLASSAGLFVNAIDDDGTVHTGTPSGAGNVTTSETLTSGVTMVGNGTTDIKKSTLTAQFVGSSSGTEAAASMTTARLLGRTTASSGAVEEITADYGTSLASTSLSVALTSATGNCSGDTNGTTDTMVDVTGATVTLAAGTWFVHAAISVSATSNTYLLASITNSSNTDVGSAGKGAIVANSNTQLSTKPVILSPGTSTTYKLRFQTGLNGTAAIARKQADNSGQVLTGVVAIRIA